MAVHLLTCTLVPEGQNEISPAIYCWAWPIRQLSPVGTAEGFWQSDGSPMFSRAYGTDSTETPFPSNELLGYYQLVPTGQGAQDGKPG